MLKFCSFFYRVLLKCSIFRCPNQPNLQSNLTGMQQHVGTKYWKLVNDFPQDDGGGGLSDRGEGSPKSDWPADLLLITDGDGDHFLHVCAHIKLISPKILDRRPFININNEL